MFEKIESRTAAIEDVDQDAGQSDYRAPELRSAGSAVKTVQGVGEFNSYDQCGHASWGC